MEYSEQGLMEISFRFTSELLDTLDLCFRLHWLARDYHIKGKEIVTIDESIIQECHYILNWLTFFENKDWDDVDTPT